MGKAIIIGGGSIGKRHSKNLNEIGIATRIVDVDEIDNIDQILLEKYDFGFVCSPNVFHIQHCLKLAEHNIPIFCEKPFYTDRTGVDQLLKIVNSKNLTTMVGCNLRFTDSVKSIDKNTPYISAYFGYNLKKWRPNTNHLESYSANKSLGGGILLDCIHELDYLFYKFGEIKEIEFDKYKLTDITNDTEDLVRGKIDFRSGTKASFSLNYLSENYTRYYDIIEKDIIKRVNLKIDNDMYKKQIEYFVQKVTQNAACMNNFNEADYLLTKILGE